MTTPLRAQEMEIDEMSPFAVPLPDRNMSILSESTQLTSISPDESIEMTSHSEMQSQSHALQEVFDKFMKRCRTKNLTEATKRFYRQQISPFIHHCDEIGVGRITLVSVGLIEDYLNMQRDRGLSDASVQASYRGLRAFMSYCVQVKLLSKSPLHELPTPRARQQNKPVLTMADIQTLLQACTTMRDIAIVLVLIDTGIRAAELINLSGGDIDLESGRVHVRNGKGRKDRYVYICEQTRQAIIKYYELRGTPRIDESIWLSTTTSAPLKQNGLNQALRRLGKRAGIEHTNPHCFRRSFALLALEQDIDIYRLAQLMGHASISTLRSYLPLVERHARDAHQRYGPLNGFNAELDDLLQ